jgi:PAS domain S-box-containing protein
MKDDISSKKLPRKTLKNARQSTRKSTDTVTCTEKNVKESEQLFRTIFENAADGILLADNESKKFFMGNKQIYKALGYGPKEIKNISVMDIHPEKDLPQILDQFEKLMRNEITVAKNIPVKRKDGTIYYADISALPITLKDKTYLVGIFRDISERKQTEESLREKDERLQTIFDNAEEIIHMIAWDGTFLYISPSWERFTGFPVSESVGKSFTLYVHPDDQAACLELVKYVHDTGQPQKILELRVRHASGKWIWFMNSGVAIKDAQGKPLYFMGVAMDITERKSAEAALLASEEKFSLAFHNSPTILAITSLSDGRFIDVNEIFLSLHGFERDEIIGHSSYELNLLVDPALLDAIPQEARASGMMKDREMQFRKKDGGVFWGLFSAVPLTIAGEPCLISRVIDITERKKAEEELQKLASIVKHSSELVNLATLDGKMVFLNEAGYQMLGIDPDRMSQINILEVIPEHLHKMVQTELLPTLRTTGTWEGELQYRNLKTGRLVDVYTITFAIKDPISNAPLYLANVSRDITERKHAEDALRESEELYTRLVDTIPDLIVRTDLDGKIRFVNDYALQVSGYTREEIEGRDMLLFISPEDRDRMIQNALLRREQKLGPREYQLLIKDGKKIPFEVNGDVLRSEEGIPFGFVYICRDITQRKEDEEEKTHLQAQLVQAQKMESVGRLAGGVAHDFNNMLSVILGNTEMAIKRLDPSDPLQKLLQDILNAGRRSADLTRQLLAFARKQVAVPRILDLNDTVSGMLKMLRRLIGEDIDLSWKPGYDLWKLMIDPSQIDQILANLTVNARDAIEQSGKIVIETTNTICDDAYCSVHPECIPGEYVMLSVSDDGFGMDKETALNIFEPFFTTKKEGQGTGLGLATVYGIVRQNNGFINVYSEPGRGTTFRIYLPRHKAEILEPADDKEEMKIQGGTETVLIVEDDEAVLDLSRRMLEGLGYQVLAVRRTDEAIRLAEEYEGTIDLLFTDVVMPDMNGKELSERVCSIRPGFKCLFTSGYTADVIARQGILEEGVHFIPKPFSLKDLAAKVREALGK